MFAFFKRSHPVVATALSNQMHAVMSELRRDLSDVASEEQRASLQSELETIEAQYRADLNRYRSACKP
jgi:alkylated DNA nucleotide flippase Atl1